MGSDTIQEPTVVRDNHSATCEVLQALLQCTQGIYIDIVGRLIEQDNIAFLLQCQRKVQAVTLTTRQNATLLLLVCTGEVKTSYICTSRHLTIAQLNPLAILRYNLIYGLLGVNRFVLLVHIGELYGLTYGESSACRLLQAHNHTEQSSLTRSVRTNHTHDTGRWQLEVQSLV